MNYLVHVLHICTLFCLSIAFSDPNYFGVSFTSVDGQRFDIGDTNLDFSVQSSSKPISYLAALQELGKLICSNSYFSSTPVSLLKGKVCCSILICRFSIVFLFVV
jgi:hypothetical protein